MVDSQYDNLPLLEKTLNSLAAYLMIAHEKHKKFVLGDPEEHANDNNQTLRQTRITQHCASALLAYGLSPESPELQRFTSWFATPFKAGEQEIDHIQMTRLEGLLNLRPNDPSVQPRLQQLINQREDSHFFEIYRFDQHESSSPIFNTLWALKVLLLARQKHVLRDLIAPRLMQQSIDRVFELGIRGQTQALALRLQYDLTSGLDKNHQQSLNDLLEESQKYDNLWGLNDSKYRRMRSIIAAMGQGRLTSFIIGKEDRIFREVIQNTCYAIENLAPLTAHFPQVRDPLYRSLRLWWHQCQGEDAPQSLQSLFSEEYDFLLVLCRTMVAVTSYVRPLGDRLILPMLRDMAEKRFGSKPWPEKKSIKRALQLWINIDLGDQGPERLNLGLSDAQVIRIEPEFSNPIDDDQRSPIQPSLIVKYGPVYDIEAERENYKQLPRGMRSIFARIPKKRYVNKKQQAFIIIEDLHNYKTLYEDYPRLTQGQSQLASLLGGFLLSMHQGDHSDLMMSSDTHLRDIYLVPMLQYISRYFNHIYNHNLLPGRQSDVRNLQHALDDLLAQILKVHERISDFPLAMMHGDLHTRNIMVQVFKQKRQSWRKAHFEFKLIDLESLRPDGDAAYDIGQLLADIDLIKNQDLTSGKIDSHGAQRLDNLGNELLAIYQDAARELHDETFMIRIYLAQSRALLRVAKSLSKQSSQRLRNNEYSEAVNLALQGFKICQTAFERLTVVHDQIT